MKLVTIDAPGGSRTGVLIDEDVLDFSRASDTVPHAGFVPREMPALLAGGDDGLDLIRRLVDTVKRNRNDEAALLRESGALRSAKDVRRLAPNPRPGIVLSHGRAYHSHLKEMARGEKPKITEEPRAFLKNINAITGPDSPIVLPRLFPNMVDFEGEFSIVFGRDCYNVDEKDAMSHVAGYTTCRRATGRNTSSGPTIPTSIVRANSCRRSARSGR
jgi:acylpyruvate hydrolase